MWTPKTAKEYLDQVELALSNKDYVEANDGLVNFWCLRLNKTYPLTDLDARFRHLGERYEKELDLNQFLDKGEQCLNENEFLGAENMILAYAELRRQGAQAKEGSDERYSTLSERLVVANSEA